MDEGKESVKCGGKGKAWAEKEAQVMVIRSDGRMNYGDWL